MDTDSGPAICRLRDAGAAFRSLVEKAVPLYDNHIF